MTKIPNSNIQAPENIQVSNVVRRTVTPPPWRRGHRKAAEDSAPYTHFQSQRDCVLQPRVARDELPWGKSARECPTLKGLWRAPPLYPSAERWRPQPFQG